MPEVGWGGGLPPKRRTRVPSPTLFIYGGSMKYASLLFVLIATLPACATEKGLDVPAKPAITSPVDTHTSRHSLDWAGAYEGVLPCADCPGIRTRLTLGSDGAFERRTLYLDRQVAPSIARGQFTWQAGGAVIALDANGGGQRYAVEEGRLIALNRDGTRPQPQEASRVLRRVSQQASHSELIQILEAHRWTLESATDSANQRNEVSSRVAGRSFVFSFSGGSINIRGGCNSLRGSYQISADEELNVTQLNVGRLASTMMACEPASMNADAALTALLAQPLRISLARGPHPQLRLVTESNEILLLKGQATPEALYGPATLIFLEVAARQVACNPPPGAAMMCLQVRERVYDTRGLAVGTPGAWRPLYENIEGYTHTPGVRNVLRIKRFQLGPAPTDASAFVYVLDITVESEVVAR